MIDVPAMLDALEIQYRTHGTELWAPCPHPDHREKKPSWSICSHPEYTGNGFHYCFGCGFQGSSIDLVETLKFPDEKAPFSRYLAKKWLEENGLFVEKKIDLDIDVQLVDRSRSGLIIPQGLRGGPLETWVTPVRRYVESREITATQVRRWRLKYAVDGSMGGRVVFPLRDIHGEWKSFHARTYCNQDKRYKNASRSDGFDPGAVFGMELWPGHEFRKNHALVVTEGTIDALACERVGARYICAIGGSQLHSKQLLKLSGWSRIVTVTDGDKAGDELATSIRSQLGRVSEVSCVELPDNEDACSLGSERLESLIGELL